MPSKTTAAPTATSGWKKHKFQIGEEGHETDDLDQAKKKAKEANIQTSLATLLRVEHLSLLVGTGLTTAIGKATNAPPISLDAGNFKADRASAVHAFAEKSAKACNRGKPNAEDDIRAAIQLVAGLQILAADTSAHPDPFLDEVRTLAKSWEQALSERFSSLAEDVLAAERTIRKGLTQESGSATRRTLLSFLLSFSMRPSSRERLQIFTTNYDRLLEFGCDLVGLQILDRFVGRLEPTFRASRLNLDLHYNPPGIRGEPRYLQGVVRLTKLHGSLDWKQTDTEVGRRIVRTSLPFGAPSDHSDFPNKETMMIYPNPAKDVETLEYPYAELFRDFSAAICQPNAVLFTFGYGFGDDHINRVISDMLTLPGTHLVIISFDTAGDRVPRFYENNGGSAKISLLIGAHFGSLQGLVEFCLPRPAFDLEISSRPTAASSTGVP